MKRKPITEELRRKRRENQKCLWNDPVYRANQKLKRENQGWREAMSKTCAESASDPKVKKVQRQKQLEYYARPGTKKAMSETNKEVQNRPVEKEKRRVKAKAMWKDDVYVAKQHIIRSTPEWKVKASARSTEIGSRPDVKRKRSEKLRVVLKGINKGRVVTQKTRDAIAQSNRNRIVSKATRAKQRLAHLGKKHPAKTLAIITRKNQERIAKGVCWKKGVFYSTKNKKEILYQSSYELKMYQLLELNNEVVQFDRCFFTIPYQFLDKLHMYIPDVFVSYMNGQTEVIEVKSEDMVNDPVNVAKFKAAISYCSSKEWRFSVVTEKDLFKEKQE